MSEETPDFGMFSKAGNQRVNTLVKYAANLTEKSSRKVILKYIQDQKKSIAKRYPEVGDTAVREAIADYLDKPFDEAGLVRLDIFEF
jgi:histidinol-phosphate/aromatic aminotransferase/cobyric acid decarboxylase-like protein